MSTYSRAKHRFIEPRESLSGPETYATTVRGVRGVHMCSGVLGDREWTHRAEGLRHAMQECLGCKRHAQGGCTSARLCHDQAGHRVVAKGRRTGYAPGIVVVVRLSPTTCRRCRSESGVDHVARRSNEHDVEKVKPAAFTRRRKTGSPAQSPRLPSEGHSGLQLRDGPSTPPIESFQPCRYPS